MFITIEYEDGCKVKFDTKAIKRTRTAWEEVCDLVREDCEKYERECKENGKEAYSENRN